MLNGFSSYFLILVGFIAAGCFVRCVSDIIQAFFRKEYEPKNFVDLNAVTVSDMNNFEFDTVVDFLIEAQAKRQELISRKFSEYSNKIENVISINQNDFDILENISAESSTDLPENKDELISNDWNDLLRQYSNRLLDNNHILENMFSLQSQCVGLPQANLKEFVEFFHFKPKNQDINEFFLKCGCQFEELQFLEDILDLSKNKDICNNNTKEFIFTIYSSHFSCNAQNKMMICRDSETPSINKEVACSKPEDYRAIRNYEAYSYFGQNLKLIALVFIQESNIDIRPLFYASSSKQFFNINQMNVHFSEKKDIKTPTFKLEKHIQTIEQIIKPVFSILVKESRGCPTMLQLTLGLTNALTFVVVDLSTALTEVRILFNDERIDNNVIKNQVIRSIVSKKKTLSATKPVEYYKTDLNKEDRVNFCHQLGNQRAVSSFSALKIYNPENARNPTISLDSILEVF